MSASDFLELEILDHILGAAVYTAPATVYISLHTGDPGETGASEATGTGYAREPVTNNATNFPAAAAGSKSNGTLIQFDVPGAGGWGLCTHVGVWDALSAGNFLMGGALTISKTINEADDVELPIGAFIVTMT